MSRGAVQLIFCLVFLSELIIGRCGKFLPKKFKKLEKGLKDIGITEDQLEGVGILLKGECKKMYLSFLSGGRERKKAKRLFKRFVPK